jgi:hypothetical protein
MLKIKSVFHVFLIVIIVLQQRFVFDVKVVILLILQVNVNYAGFSIVFYAKIPQNA